MESFKDTLEIKQQALKQAKCDYCPLFHLIWYVKATDERLDKAAQVLFYSLEVVKLNGKKIDFIKV